MTVLPSRYFSASLALHFGPLTLTDLYPFAYLQHGPPSPINSHPHASGPANEFVVVHNGIISNYSTLKDLLLREGYVFLSQTDTEVVPKLMDYLYRKQGGNITMPKLAMQVTSYTAACMTPSATLSMACSIAAGCPECIPMDDNEILFMSHQSTILHQTAKCCSPRRLAEHAAQGFTNMQAHLYSCILLSCFAN
jgi:glucosamine 6-phosphate synthetase-like amidotransferase/phosphosugar isomerase protein